MCINILSYLFSCARGDRLASAVHLEGGNGIGIDYPIRIM